LLKEGFFGTTAPLIADLVLLLEMAMGRGYSLVLGSHAVIAFGNTRGANPSSCF
jgi:hypothetical protein